MAERQDFQHSPPLKNRKEAQIMVSFVTLVPTRIMALSVLGLALAGCPQPVPRVSIPGTDASPPSLVWQTYSLQAKERREIAQDGQSVDVPSSEQFVVTLAVEDLNSGVKEVSLTGNTRFTCEQGGQVEEKKYDLEPQNQKAIPDHENKVPVRASLVYSVDVNKHGCKEKWTFGGGTISLVGKGQNFVNGNQMKTLRLNLQRQP
jgi:hypothetical protein